MGRGDDLWVAVGLVIVLLRLIGSGGSEGTPSDTAAGQAATTTTQVESTTVAHDTTATVAAVAASTTTMSPETTTTAPETTTTAEATSGTLDQTTPADVPALVAIQTPDGEVGPGTDVPVSLTVTGATDVTTVIFKRPSGVSATLPMTQFSRNGDVFTANIELPTSAATGTWVVSEVIVFGVDGDQYHILNPETFPSVGDCTQGYRYSGGPMCASQALSGDSQFTVGGDNMALPTPSLEAVHVTPSMVKPGDTFELRAKIGGAEKIQTVFFAHEASGETVIFQVSSTRRDGDEYVVDVTVPESVRGREYIIEELVVADPINEDLTGSPIHTNRVAGHSAPTWKTRVPASNVRANILLDVVVTVAS